MKLHDSPRAPRAIGPYSHAVCSGRLVFCSGQTPIDPTTSLLFGTTIEEQTERVLANLSLVLEELDLTLADVVKTTVFLENMGDFAGMNRVYERCFGSHRPARTTVAVRQNPLGALVEIECIAELQAGVPVSERRS